MAKLKISETLSLPADAVTQTFGILAVRGAGKTYTAAVLMEELIKAGERVCVIDPIGVWSGIRSSADGRSPGLPVVILGGERADVPLEVSAGKVIANFVVEEHASCVLDVSLFRKGEQARFLTDFAETLYHRNREPLHLILDEADAFAPQRPMRGAERLLGAIEDLVRRGRARGLGCTLVTQRSAVLNKDVLTQVETLIAMRTIAPQDRAAIDAWIRVHGDEEKRATVMDSLAKLKRGECWVWSPAWLGVLQRVHIRARETYDSSATPTSGAKRAGPKAFAAVDLAALSARIADTIERHKAEDPKALRAQVAALQAELERAKQTTAARAKEKPAPAKPLIDTSTRAMLERFSKQADKLTQGLEAYTKHATEVAAALRLLTDEREAAKAPPLVAAAIPTAEELAALRRSFAAPDAREAKPAADYSLLSDKRARRIAKADASATNGALGLGDLRILTATAQQHDGATREQLSVLTGYKRATRDRYLLNLRDRDLVTERGRKIYPTPAGIAELGSNFEPLPTGAELRRHWLANLPEGERRILGKLVDVYPSPVERETLTELTGYKRATRDRYLLNLRNRQLVRVDDTAIIAAGELFSR